VPGGDVRAAGVTGVGVIPTHRRRGVLTGLMRRQLADVREWGEPVAILWASEASIYPRFGYGLATRNARLDADRSRTLGPASAPGGGRVRLVSHEEALELLPPVYDRIRAVSPGFFARWPDWWDAHTLADPEHERDGAGPLFRAILELDGRPEGYALYSVRHEWSQEGPGAKVQVREALATTPAATQELWRYLFGVDLVERVQARRLPADHPLFLLAAEPPRLRFSLGDGLWLRLVDLPAALALRGYAAEGALVLEVADAFCPWNDGRWLVEAAPDAAAVERATGEPELRLPAGALAAAYLGGHSIADLARACLVEELAPGAVARADHLFRTDRAPWCPEGF